jgi:hypothetical protein
MPEVPMTPVRTANCILFLMMGLGLGEGEFLPRSGYNEMHVIAGLTINYLLFLWYRSDSDARGLPRSRLPGIAVFALPLAAVPAYLLRSRQVEERGTALAAFFGLVLAMPVARWVGTLMHHAIRQIGA